VIQTLKTALEAQMNPPRDKKKVKKYTIPRTLRILSPPHKIAVSKIKKKDKNLRDAQDDMNSFSSL